MQFSNLPKKHRSTSKSPNIKIDHTHIVTPHQKDPTPKTPLNKLGPIIRMGGLGPKKIATILVTVLLVWGLVSGTLLVGLKQELREKAAPEGPAKAACAVYGVDDQGSKDTQFFKIDIKDDNKVEKLGPIYPGYDVEAMDIHPGTNTLYAVAGSGGKRGILFIIDAESGVLTEVGNTDFNDVEALSFSPTHATLWGWAEDKGLIQIDIANASSTLIFESDIDIEGLAWSNDGTLLYGAEKRNLWVFNPENSSLEHLADNLPGETEALEMQPNGLLMGGVHKSDDKTSIFAYDIEEKSVVANEHIRTPFNDVEAIAWPESCGSPPIGDLPEEPEPSEVPIPEPTISPHPTLAPSPSPAPVDEGEPTTNISNLQFAVRFQGITTKRPDKKLRVILKNNGTEKYSRQEVATSADSEGLYSGNLEDIEGGVYSTALVKAPYRLQRKFTNVQTKSEGGPDQNWSDKVLLAGDFNSDNKLDVTDLGKILSVYNKLSIEVDSENQIYDVNEDGKINIFDISIVLSNYTELSIKGDE